MPKKSAEKIERMTLKLPQSVAKYFRDNFPHGERSRFVADCLMEHKKQGEIEAMEDKLRRVAQYRQ